MHTKFSLKKLSVKAMDELSVGFAYLRQKYSTIHEAKMKERIFAAPQITQLFAEKDFRTKLHFKKSRAWEAFENFCRSFLGNEKDENYSEIVQDLISSQSAMGCNVTLTRHFLHSNLEFFLKTWLPSPRDLAKISTRV